MKEERSVSVSRKQRKHMTEQMSMPAEQRNPRELVIISPSDLMGIIVYTPRSHVILFSTILLLWFQGYICNKGKHKIPLLVSQFCLIRNFR